MKATNEVIARASDSVNWAFEFVKACVRLQRLTLGGSIEELQEHDSLVDKNCQNIRDLLSKVPVSPEVDRKKWSVVHMPTALGFIAFGWLPSLHSQHNTEEAAKEEAHMTELDETAPDKREYSTYIVVPPQGKPNG